MKSDKLEPYKSADLVMLHKINQLIDIVNNTNNGQPVIRYPELDMKINWSTAYMNGFKFAIDEMRSLNEGQPSAQGLVDSLREILESTDGVDVSRFWSALIKAKSALAEWEGKGGERDE